ncbi:MAG: hypothetical protein H6645_05445 [Caldilineaceae bacterium]|nr:hypothetical protein [Caldilineaceae bacterium]
MMKLRPLRGLGSDWAIRPKPPIRPVAGWVRACFGEALRSAKERQPRRADHCGASAASFAFVTEHKHSGLTPLKKETFSRQLQLPCKSCFNWPEAAPIHLSWARMILTHRSLFHRRLFHCRYFTVAFSPDFFAPGFQKTDRLIEIALYHYATAMPQTEM